MKRLVAILFALALVATLHAGGTTPPNLILILADDLGIGNVSCYGADNFKTPRIDALASGGMRFQNCYATPLCGPSRALLLSGRYAFRTGMTGNSSGENLKSASEIMIPRVLKPVGYVSGCFGKWGQLPLQPSDFGFDEYMRFHNSGVYWKGPKRSSYVVNGKDHELADGEYMPDVVQKYLLDFIRRHRDQPFFAYYPMSHVHAEMVRTPDSAADSKDYFADNILYMDKLVGNLVDELEKLGLREKTLVIFVGDNGTGQREAPRSTIGGKEISGHKGQMLEGGSLVPTVASWPGTLPAGKVCTDLIDFSDYLPTFAELAKAALPAGVTIDGHSFAARLRGGKATPRDWIFMELGSHWYVRDAQWKLNEAGELFDMKGAPFEEKLVSADGENPEAKATRAKLRSILAQINPAGGIAHRGDPSGKHDKKKKKRKKSDAG